MKITLHFVRHGETMFNVEDRVQGWADSFLTPQGIEGVKRLGKYWREHKQTFDCVYSSDSGRTLQTARTIVETMGEVLDIVPLSGLREYNFGYYEGREQQTLDDDLLKRALTFSDLVDRPDVLFDTLASLDAEKKAGNPNNWFSETNEKYRNRLLATMDDIMKENLQRNHKNVLVVSHGVSIVYLLYHICPEYWEHAEMNKVANASVSTVEYDNGKYRLLGFGEVKE